MSLRLYLLVDELRLSLFPQRRKRQREVRMLMTQYVFPDLNRSMLDDYLPESYPWCFIIFPDGKRNKHVYVGALIVQRGEQGAGIPVAIYGVVSYPWLKKNIQTEFPLPFWAARILNNERYNDLTDKNWQPLWQWVKALGRSYSTFWESFALNPAWQFKNQSQVLLREGSQDDFRIKESDGVDVMPWKNWPDCVQQEAGIWLWRESRHRKILDSRNISLRRAEAKSPDASF